MWKINIILHRFSCFTSTYTAFVITNYTTSHNDHIVGSESYWNPSQFRSIKHILQSVLQVLLPKLCTWITAMAGTSIRETVLVIIHWHSRQKQNWMWRHVPGDRASCGRNHRPSWISEAAQTCRDGRWRRSPAWPQRQRHSVYWWQSPESCTWHTDTNVKDNNTEEYDASIKWCALGNKRILHIFCEDNCFKLCIVGGPL